MAPHPSDPFAFADIHLLLHHAHHDAAVLSQPLSRHSSSSLSNSSSTPHAPSHSSKRHRKRKPSNGKASRSSVPLHYLKPGALAQLRDAQKIARISHCAASLCAKKKRVDDQIDPGESLFGPHQIQMDGAREPQDAAIASLAPVPSTRLFGPLCPQRKKLLAPKLILPFNPEMASAFTQASAPAPSPVTPPVVAAPSYDSLLESLPLELLVRIVCNLRHDQLKSAFHVSKRVRQAVLIARQCHFDYTTPDRERQEILNTPVKRMFFRVNNGTVERPPTPRAPRQTQRPPQSRIPLAELQQLAVPLFHDGREHVNDRHQHHHHHHHHRHGHHGHRHNHHQGLPVRAVASHRVLFNEDELCQAVAQNTL